MDHKAAVAALAFVGFASIASQLLSLLSVLAQTFILSGTKVHLYRFLGSRLTPRYSSRNMEQNGALTPVRATRVHENRLICM